MRRWIKRLLILAAAIILPPSIILAERGSHALVVPARRAVQDYHRAILADQSAHGLEVHHFNTPDGAPAMIMLPSSDPGLATKSRALRTALEQRGLTLPPFGQTIGTIVLLHGRNGRKEDHLPIAERFCAAGFACICIDLPGHGDSPTPYATFGHQECHHLPDLLAAARKAHDLPAPVALFGYSQGGAIALQTAAEPGNDCFAVISIASFSDLGTIVEQRAHTLHPVTDALASPCTGLVRLGTRLRAGFDPADIRPDLAAAKLAIPVFILHGADDHFIPPTHAQRIYDAVPHADKRLQFVPAAEHGNVLSTGGTPLYADLCQFLLEKIAPISNRR